LTGHASGLLHLLEAQAVQDEREELFLAYWAVFWSNGFWVDSFTCLGSVIDN